MRRRIFAIGFMAMLASACSEQDFSLRAVATVALKTPTPLPNSVPASTPTAVPSFASTIGLTSIAAKPTTSALPQSGQLIYEADWSSGLNGWPESAGWKAVSGMYVNDGGDGYVVLAPVFSLIANVAVEAKIQYLRASRGDARFGLALRMQHDGKGYTSSFDPQGGEVTITYARGDIFASIKSLTHDTAEHTYRFEAIGNKLQLLVDNVLLLAPPDNLYVTGGGIGVWSYGCQLTMTSYKVFAL